MKRRHRILTALAMNCAGVGAYVYGVHLAPPEEGRAASLAAPEAMEKSAPPSSDPESRKPSPAPEPQAPTVSKDLPVIHIDLNTPELARLALHEKIEISHLPEDDTLDPIIISMDGIGTAEPGNPDDGSPSIELPSILLPADLHEGEGPPRILLPDDLSDSEEVTPFPIPDKPDYVKFVIGHAGETANGFLERDGRVSIAESTLPDMPEAYQVLPYESHLHKLQDFPGFCTVISHASGDAGEYLWLPQVSSPEGFEAYSQIAASSTAQRLLAAGQIDPVTVPGWTMRNWVICSDRAVDGAAPFTRPQSITWLNGIHLTSDTEVAEGDVIDG
jgi:hypothetical protein